VCAPAPSSYRGLATVLINDLAGQLVVTLDTVKKHVSHILGKLGAANRTEAVSRAREVRLIPLPWPPSPGAASHPGGWPGTR